MQYLVQHHANVFHETQERKTALIHAARNGKCDIVRFLLSKYRELCLPRHAKESYTASAVAPEGKNDHGGAHDDLEWHTLFLQHVMLIDKEGKNALEHAQEEKHASVVECLEESIKHAMEHVKLVSTLRTKTNVVACKFNCGFFHEKDLIQFHEESKCPRRILECDKCGAKIMSLHDDEHKVCLIRRPIDLSMTETLMM